MLISRRGSYGIRLFLEAVRKWLNCFNNINMQLDCRQVDCAIKAVPIAYNCSIREYVIQTFHFNTLSRNIQVKKPRTNVTKHKAHQCNLKQEVIILERLNGSQQLTQ